MAKKSAAAAARKSTRKAVTKNKGGQKGGKLLQKEENVVFRGPVIPFEVLISLVAQYLPCREYLRLRRTCHQLQDNLPLAPTLSVVNYIDACYILQKWVIYSQSVQPYSFKPLYFTVNAKDLYQNESNCEILVQVLSNLKGFPVCNMVFTSITLQAIENIVDSIDDEMDEFQDLFIMACRYKNYPIVKYCLDIPAVSPSYIEKKTFWRALRSVRCKDFIELFFRYQERCHQIFQIEEGVLHYLEEYDASKDETGPGMDVLRILIKDYCDEEQVWEVYFEALAHPDFEHLDAFLEDPRIDPRRNDNEAMKLALIGHCFNSILALLKDGRIDPTFDDLKEFPAFFSSKRTDYFEGLQTSVDILNLVINGSAAPPDLQVINCPA